MATGEIKSLILADGVEIASPSQISGTYAYDDTTNWDGTTGSVTYDVSSGVPDARETLWQFKKLVSSGVYELVLAEIRELSATEVKVTANVEAGTYRLMGKY